MGNKFKPSKDEIILADQLREAGQPNTAEYVEMFGVKKLSPWFFNTSSVKQKENFYKKCVEDGKTWEHYQGAFEDAIL